MVLFIPLYNPGKCCNTNIDYNDLQLSTITKLINKVPLHHSDAVGNNEVI
jgi:hypothetical protein